MCLNISVSFPNPIPVLECWKVLVKRKGQWVTCYKRTPVPENGVLLPGDSFIDEGDNQKKNLRHNTKTIKKHEKEQLSVTGGAIHAYTSLKTAKNKTIHSREKKVFRAIARNVLAMGDRSDLVCKELYIPELDKNNTDNLYSRKVSVKI